MKSHLDGCVKYKRAERERRRDAESSEPHLGFFCDVEAADSPTRGPMTDDKLCEQVLRIITEGNLPFSFAENRQFVKLLKHAYSGVKIPNRRSAAAKLKNNVTKEKEKLRACFAELDSRISLALDA
jgi:hypothetical protein